MAPRTRKRANRTGARRPKRIVKLPAQYFPALDLGNVIFPPLYQLENGLRLVLNGYLATCYGVDWWTVSLKTRRKEIFDYAEEQQRKLSLMPWMGSSSEVEVLPVHLITLGQLEEIVRTYRSDCIPELFPSLEFFIGHMEVIKRVRNMYTHMFPCITREDCEVAKSEIRVLARHINSRLQAS